MIPTKQPYGTHNKSTKGVINGSRPSPLKIRQVSHGSIHKQSSSFSSSSLRKQNRKKTDIVYARSPKIIHTNAHDFMALVQKLTGLSHDQALQNSINEGQISRDEKFRLTNNYYQEYASRIDDEKDRGMTSLYSPLFRMPINHSLADIPLFTPNLPDFFCSPRPLSGLSTMVFLSSSIGNSLSPSFMEAMKGLPKY